MVATAMPDGIEVELVKHQKMERGYFYSHMAIIKTKSNAMNIDVGNKVVKITSKKVGFDTGVFGLFNYTVREHPPENTYLISWETEVYAV